jgi:hypothetical protein
MAAVTLGYTALENFTAGLELRLSAVMAAVTSRPNLMSAQPELWSQCMRLKKRREALGHLTAAQAFRPSSMNADETPSTVWADLLSV